VDDVTQHAGLSPVESATSDPVGTELIRNALSSAAGQMRGVLMRTAFSQLIYEVLDFACALYDRNVRLLAQAPSLALFLGTLDACVDRAIAAVGGEENLLPGDILVYNIPYGTGSHPQDTALVMPAHLNGVLIGYAVCKAHWVDIGGKEVYSTDTVDLYQEGTFFPGVRLYRAGERNEDIWQMIVANSRAPELLGGDISAQVGAVRTGARALAAVVAKYGPDRFDAAAERIFAHGEAGVRERLRAIPDGRYTSDCLIDNDGLTDEPIPFEVVVEVVDDTLIVDLSSAPDQTPGPVNSPLPGTVSAARLALAALAPDIESPNDGQFRPVEVRTRPGSIFEPVQPAPAFNFWIPQVKLIDGILRALAPVVPEIPADSGGDILAIVWWGHQRAEFHHRASATHEPWIDGAPAPVGQGAHRDNDGANALMHLSEACTRISPAEVWEANNPWLVQRLELSPDSCGAGERRGGLGIVCELRCLEDGYVTPVMEATKREPQGLCNGGPARANRAFIRHHDGSTTGVVKATGLLVKRGEVFVLETGGGGGHGEPSLRSTALVAADLENGYISETFARRWYPRQLQELGS
jgi:N-methylhydantoinase B